MDAAVRECVALVSRLAGVPFDKALPAFQKEVWEIADRHGMTGPELVQRYMDWKSAQS